MYGRKLATVFIIAALTLPGCARLNSIHRTDNLGWFAGKVIHTDAKQRAILTAKKRLYDKKGKLEEKYWQFCIEPPPDVFSALASSLSGRASLAESGNPVSKDISAELATTLSENASTIERTQTVNILRESMYRTCERFLSGGIGKTEFIVQSARDQRAMVAVLAVEQLTGVQKAQATALTTVATAAADGVSEKSLEILNQAKKDAQAAKERAAAKRTEANAAAPPDDCETAKASDDANHKTKKDLCVEADTLEAEQKEAEQYFATVKKAVENQASLSAEAKGTLHTAALNGSAANQNIAAHVVEIVKEVNDFDELTMTCVVIFRAIADGSIKFEKDDSLQQACLERVNAAVEQSTAEAKKVTAEKELETQKTKQEAEQIRIQLESTLSHQTKTLWNFVFEGQSVDASKLEQALTGVSISRIDRKAMEDAQSVAAFGLALGKVAPDTRAKIMNNLSLM